MLRVDMPMRAPTTAPRRPRWPWVVFAAVLGVLVIAAASVVLVRLTAALPPPTVQINTAATLALGETAPGAIPLPPRGSFALSASTLGTVATYNATVERPTGSVAKAMTALVVLEALPLAPGAEGPSRTMTAADVQLYRQAVAAGGSNLAVRAGEVLTERDLLLALLLPSADNIAESLAVWVSGNRTAFIARLNAKAAALGMAHTHYADPSGLSNQTVSTAADLVLLAKAVISSPALAALVAVQQVRLTNGTVLHNLDVLLQQPGWLGIKTGWTGAAGGCLLFAAQRSYGTAPGLSVTVWGAVLGQPAMTAPDPAHPELGAAFFEAKNAVVAMLDSYRAVDLSQTTPSLSGSVSTPWGSTALVELLPLEGSKPVLVRGAAALQLSVATFKAAAPLRANAQVGQINGVLNGIKVTWPVIVSDAIAAPSLWWKLVNG
jgi:serine-type D-Ala-D-Ala carboxypeptidase (penicillin-binding protein 5/6)